MLIINRTKLKNKIAPKTNIIIMEITVKEAEIEKIIDKAFLKELIGFKSKKEDPIQIKTECFKPSTLMMEKGKSVIHKD